MCANDSCNCPHFTDKIQLQEPSTVVHTSNALHWWAAVGGYGGGQVNLRVQGQPVYRVSATVVWGP